MRFYYTMKQGWRHRRALTAFLKPSHQLKHVNQLSPNQLDFMSIKALSLDFDGVLAPHGEVAPLPEIEIWLHGLLQTWSGQVFILSNKPFDEREAYLRAHFPKITFIKHVAKKPYPDGLNQIRKLAHCRSEEVLMVDDRLLTGMLAAMISGSQGLWIHPAVRKHGWHRHELFFAFLRKLDRCLVGVFNH